MKRFVLLAAAVLMCCLNSFAQDDVRSLFTRYSGTENASLLSVDRKTFNFVKVLIPMDKETKKLLKALDLEQIDILDLSGTSCSVRDSVIHELQSISSSGLFMVVSKEDDDIAMMARREGDLLKEFTIFSLKSSDQNGSFIRIDCNAHLATILEMVGDER